jgi:hypothetical protein
MKKIFLALSLIILGSFMISLIGVKLFHFEGSDLRIFSAIFGLINGALIGIYCGNKKW